MNKNLEELKRVESFYCFEVKEYMIPLLEDFEKKIEELSKKVKKLEQVQTYFPLEYHETNKTGGVNNIRVEFTNPDMNKEGKE